MKTYQALFRIRFSSSLQYRTAALAGMATQFVWGFMQLLAFSVFYKTDPSTFPMTLSQTASYIWIQQAFLALFMNWFFDPDIFEAITSGSVAYELVRPVDLYSRWFCQSAATRLAKAVLRCLPILIAAFTVPEPFRMALPASPVRFLLFLCSACLAVGVVVSYNMLVYISTFYTLNPAGVRLISAISADFMSGGIIPLPFFPPAFRTVADVLPFGSMQNMPLLIYSGAAAGPALLRGMMLQLFWTAALIIAGRIMMNHALRRVIIQGG